MLTVMQAQLDGAMTPRSETSKKETPAELLRPELETPLCVGEEEAGRNSPCCDSTYSLLKDYVDLKHLDIPWTPYSRLPDSGKAA